VSPVAELSPASFCLGPNSLAFDFPFGKSRQERRGNEQVIDLVVLAWCRIMAMRPAIVARRQFVENIS
jgi:hypothetical protein